MFKVIDRTNKHRYPEIMHGQYRLRHEIFVKEKGWKEFEAGNYETDNYDNDAAVYFASVEGADDVVGGFRLYPTTLPHMISEEFPHLVEGAIIQRPDVMEWTRFAICRERRRSTTYSELLAAMQEYGLMEGLSGVTAVIRTHRVRAMQAAGCTVLPLGLPHDIGGESCVALYFEIGEDVLDRIREVGGLPGSVLDPDPRLPSRDVDVKINQ
jgi:acyl-homoserine lactone synthase